MRSPQRGFSLLELLLVVAVILIIAAIAIPNLMRSRMAANEASAVASIRSVNTSEVVYQSSYGLGYSANLPDLSDGGNPGNCAALVTPTATSACLIDSVLAAGTKGGYTFTYTPTAVGAFVTQYTVNADPQIAGSSGQRHFFADQTLVIRYNLAAAAGPADPAI